MLNKLFVVSLVVYTYNNHYVVHLKLTQCYINYVSKMFGRGTFSYLEHKDTLNYYLKKLCSFAFFGSTRSGFCVQCEVRI